MVAHFGQWTFDSSLRQVIAASGEVAHVTPKAFDLLALLIEESPRVVHKSTLHARLWPDTFVADATLTGLVKELRRVLRDRDPASPFIRTSHGMGYAFCVALNPASATRRVDRWVIARGLRIPLKDGDNLIGRHPDSDIWLDAAGISRRHARIRVTGCISEIEDLGSKNGTLVGDVRLAGPMLLQDGDTIHAGPLAIVYRSADTGMSTETA